MSLAVKPAGLAATMPKSRLNVVSSLCMDSLQRYGCQLLDTPTACPQVLTAQEIRRESTREGYPIRAP